MSKSRATSTPNLLTRLSSVPHISLHIIYPFLSLRSRSCRMEALDSKCTYVAHVLDMYVCLGDVKVRFDIHCVSIFTQPLEAMGSMTSSHRCPTYPSLERHSPRAAPTPESRAAALLSGYLRAALLSGHLLVSKKFQPLLLTR